MFQTDFTTRNTITRIRDKLEAYGTVKVLESKVQQDCDINKLRENFGRKICKISRKFIFQAAHNVGITKSDVHRIVKLLDLKCCILRLVSVLIQDCSERRVPLCI